MEIHLDARDGYLRLNVSCRDAGPLPPRLLCPNVAPRVSRKSSNFSGRIVGAMFMRVNLKCVQVPNYAGLMERLIPFYERQRDLTLELMPLDRSLPLRVLDLGCGPGLMASRIRAEYPQAQLTLIDLTTEMIDVCRSRFEGFDRSNPLGVVGKLNIPAAGGQLGRQSSSQIHPECQFAWGFLHVKEMPSRASTGRDQSVLV